MNAESRQQSEMTMLNTEPRSSSSASGGASKRPDRDTRSRDQAGAGNRAARDGSRGIAGGPQREPGGASPVEDFTYPIRELVEYQRDFLERIVLFRDGLRRRADNMLAHERAGMPPLLDFKYEMLLDGRRFECPANHALLRITEID